MNRRRFSGFTLVELMIVVVIIAILAAVAYPSYQDHVRKSKRTEGKAALLKAAQLQERYYSDRQVYADNNTFPTLFALAAGAQVFSSEDAKLPPPPPPAVKRPSYQITVDAPVPAGPTPCVLAVCYALTATPLAPANGGDLIDPGCGNLTLNSVGVRGRTGTAPMKDCW
jgi:type IV pilus assembly protein PilE